MVSQRAVAITRSMTPPCDRVKQQQQQQRQSCPAALAPRGRSSTSSSSSDPSSPKHRKRETLPDIARRIPVDALRPFLKLSLVSAAKAMGISATTLKRLCRHYGIKRWPYRQISGIDRTVGRLEAELAASSDGSEELLAPIAAHIHELNLHREGMVKLALEGGHEPVRAKLASVGVFVNTVQGSREAKAARNPFPRSASAHEHSGGCVSMKAGGSGDGGGSLAAGVSAAAVVSPQRDIVAHTPIRPPFSALMASSSSDDDTCSGEGSISGSGGGASPLGREDLQILLMPESPLSHMDHGASDTLSDSPISSCTSPSLLDGFEGSVASSPVPATVGGSVLPVAAPLIPAINEARTAASAVNASSGAHRDAGYSLPSSAVAPGVGLPIVMDSVSPLHKGACSSSYEDIRGGGTGLSLSRGTKTVPFGTDHLAPSPAVEWKQDPQFFQDGIGLVSPTLPVDGVCSMGGAQQMAPVPASPMPFVNLPFDEVVPRYDLVGGSENDMTIEDFHLLGEMAFGLDVNGGGGGGSSEGDGGSALIGANQGGSVMSGWDMESPPRRSRVLDMSHPSCLQLPETLFGQLPGGCIM